MKHYLPIVCLLLTSCSNLPPAIEDPPAYDLGYLEATTNMAKFKNAPVRWGGIIVEVENEPNFSALQVLAYPLGSNGRPDLDGANPGRFVMKSPGLLDPALYTKNKQITVAGLLAGTTERKIGNRTVQLPMVNANHIQLWEEIDYYSPYYGGYGGWGYGFGYGSGFYPYGGFGYSPYYWGGGYRPYNPGPRTPAHPPRRR